MQKLFRYLILSSLTLIPAAAATTSFSFATPVVLSPTEAPGAWYPDRFPPNGFVSPVTAYGTMNTLQETIAAGDLQAGTSFYNTQGRKLDMPANTLSVSISLYVPSAWATENQRIAGFWATSLDNLGNVGDFPIVEFQGPITSQPASGPGYDPNGGIPGFYYFDNVNGVFVFIGLPPGTYNSWVQITMTLIPGVGFQYTVTASGGSLSVTAPLSDPADVSLANVILEGYNYGTNYSINWIGLSASSPTSALTSGNNCNGVFTGPFKGNINVSAGQNCVIINGYIQGNVQQTGGTLVLTGSSGQTTVQGNVQTQGAGTVTVGPATTIIGNLEIQNLPAGSSADSVCGSTINGNVQYQNSGAAIAIGSLSVLQPCAGNTINGNLEVQNNTAPVVLDGNAVHGNLQVQNDTASVDVEGNTVHGNLQIQNNKGNPTEVGVVSPNSAGGGIQCQGNTHSSGQCTQ